MKPHYLITIILALFWIVGCIAQPSPATIPPTPIPEAVPSATSDLSVTVADETALEMAPFVDVLSADVVVQNGRLQVLARLKFTNQCHNVGGITQSKRGRNLQIEIAQIQADNIGCAAQTREIEQVVEIDTLDLEPSFYTLNVNNLATSFALDESLRAELDAALTAEEMAIATAVVQATATAVADATRAVREELGLGEIHGAIWHDVCVSDFTADDTESEDEAIPAGCVRLDSGAITADGVRESQETEEGIPFVEVSLLDGNCSEEPDTVVSRTMSGANGQFDFYDVLSGAYCLRVEQSDINLAILDQGIWTTGGQEDAFAQSVEVIASQVITGLTLGWDYEFLPRSDVAAGCVNKGLLIEDVTLVNADQLDAGGIVTKSWWVQNIGTCTWTPEYSLAWVNADGTVDTDRTVSLLVTAAPNETRKIDLPVALPSRRGNYRWAWYLVDEDLRPFSVALVGDEPLSFEFAISQPLVPTATPES